MSKKRKKKASREKAAVRVIDSAISGLEKLRESVSKDVDYKAIGEKTTDAVRKVGNAVGSLGPAAAVKRYGKAFAEGFTEGLGNNPSLTMKEK